MNKENSHISANKEMSQQKKKKYNMQISARYFSHVYRSTGVLYLFWQIRHETCLMLCKKLA